jgi:lipoyl-dependent peroxiredoxin
MATRNGSATWTGDLKAGSGELVIGEGAWTSAYSASSRFASVLPGFEDGAGTNPEELLASAHAACFSMALSLALTEAGFAPGSIETRARVHLRLVDGAPTIDQIEIETEGTVPGLDQDRFEGLAEEAKTGCIISRALGGVEQINLSATLVS